MTEDIRRLEQELDELLPPDHEGERRAHNLTRRDILAIATVIQKTAPPATCSMGLTAEEVAMIKRFLTWLNKSLALIGALIITAMVGTCLLYTSPSPRD